MTERPFCNLSVSDGKLDVGSVRRTSQLVRAAIPHYTYVVYDRSGGVLYVGVTHNPVGRLRAHSRSSPWMKDARRVRVYQHVIRDAALQHEMSLIRRLRPPHNTVGVWGLT